VTEFWNDGGLDSGNHTQMAKHSSYVQVQRLEVRKGTKMFNYGNLIVFLAVWERCVVFSPETSRLRKK
jgi:hypothetical protein